MPQTTVNHQQQRWGKAGRRIEAFTRWRVRITRWHVQVTLLVHGCPVGTRLVSMEAEDNVGHGGEERVELNLKEERRSKFENSNL
jgi:hypothetical protein